MIEIRKRRYNLVVATFFATAILTTTATPAWAEEADAGGGVCWMPVQTGITQCFADEAAMAEAIFEQTGTVLVEPGSPQARSAGGVVALASYAVAKLYENASYGGAYVTVSAPSTTYCTTSSISVSPMPSGWNDRVSSVESSYGCQVRLFSDSGYSGSAATYTDASSLGAMNNVTSSYRVF